MASGRPILSANQVTLLRLALIPLPAWLLYQGRVGQYWAVILGTIIGCTDFVDGYLARKYGPTVLGGLMDPIADKVFTAIVFLPAIDLGWVPPVAVGMLFVREFLVTAARTVYERRDLSLKSSYLARYKTWVQMCGIGVLLFCNALAPRTVSLFLGILAIAPLVAFCASLLLLKKRWRGAAAFTASFAVVWGVHELFGPHGLSTVLTWFIVGVTWVSGLGYLTESGRLRGRGILQAGEAIRLFTCVALPILVVIAEARDVGPKWAVIGLVCIELAHGGLDNLLAHHHAEASAFHWGGRVVGECFLLVSALWLGSGSAASSLIVVALSCGLFGLVVAFVQNRRFYIDTSAAVVRGGVVA
jgi:cardiolipin synthase